MSVIEASRLGPIVAPSIVEATTARRWAADKVAADGARCLAWNTRIIVRRVCGTYGLAAGCERTQVAHWRVRNELQGGVRSITGQLCGIARAGCAVGCPQAGGERKHEELGHDHGFYG